MYIYAIVLVLCRNPAVSGKILSTKERERGARWPPNTLVPNFLQNTETIIFPWNWSKFLYLSSFQHFFLEKACKGNLNKDDFLHFSQIIPPSTYFRKTIWSCVPVTIILPLFHSKNRKNEIFLEDLVEPADCLLVEVKVKSHFDFKTFSRHHTNFFNSFFFW